jgi:hypothetical protein
MSTPDLLNSAAMLCNGTGLLLTVLVYQKTESRTFLYQKTELPALAKRDAQRHRLAVAAFIVLGLAFVLQIAAQFME